jgi:Leucine-rich repeat (LRR) protein
MKRFFLLIICLFLISCSNAQVINFPDNNLYFKLIYSQPNNLVAKDLNGNYIYVDQNSNSQIELSEAQNVSTLFLNHTSFNDPYIIDLTGIEYFTNLKELTCSYQNLNNLNLTSLIQLEKFVCNESTLDNLDISNLSNLKYLDVRANNLGVLNVNGLNSIEYIDITTNNFQNLNFTLLTSLKTLKCSYNDITSLNVQNLNNLIEIECANNLLSAINLSGLNNLHTLNCSSNNLTAIDFTVINQLETLYCSINQLTSIDIGNQFNLSRLACGYNSITQLNCSSLLQLQYLYCGHTSLTSLDLSMNTNLFEVDCSNSNLTNLIMPNSSSLYQLDCNNNMLVDLDISSCTALYKLICYNNELIYLNIKNGYYNNYYNLFFGGNYDLHSICADENEIMEVNHCIYFYAEYTDYADVNTYCSFTPGGTYYTIQGNQKIDSNINGCDGNDILFPNLNMNITDGSVSGNIISNSSGNYSIFVGQGTHTITPILENPTYFNISPTSIQVAFPDVTSPSIQNFCITPNGIHNDLEVVIVPLDPARPGFDATYKIVYKNKGNTTMSGSVSFNFEDDKMDLVSSAPIYTIQSTNLLIYDYTNLAPFESREIIITINVNSPIETPAVNIGDQLNFTATLNPITGDEFLSDNISSLKQVVVGSFDPNDKTCIEGTIVEPSVIGQYIHYVIRFENTGTFAAENIVVKDMIDLNKFDLNTLIPGSSSHAFVTRVASDGKVEFIFEGINLPFDDANNDGYVVFKIKTKPTLAVGDTFSNKANIYFDYNFPIVTNTATTTIQALDTNDFEFNTYFTLYPNPAKEVVTILAKENVNISSINIYNTLGQLVLVEVNPTTSIDVSSLKKGNYFVKIISDKGMTTTKLIKQ